MKRRSFTKIAKNIIFLCLIALFMIEPSTVIAAPGSWIESSPGTINTVPDELRSSTVRIWSKDGENGIPHRIGELQADGTVKYGNEEIPWINAIMGRIFAAPGDGIETLLGKANISIQTIMFGKAAGEKEIDLNGGKIPAHNLFQFSLDDGNPYGYIGATVYAVLRTVVLLFIAVMVMFQLAKAGVTVTGQDKSMMKEAVYSGFIVLAMLFFMPNIVDLLVYLKDVILVTVSSMMPGGTMDIVGTFWNNFRCESGFLNGLMYSASVIFMLYLMFLYIGNAIALGCLFAFFPFVAFLSMTDKGTFMNWFKQFLGTVMIPVIDGILLLIPAYLMSLAGGSVITALISFIACLFIVPARKAIREALGFGGAGWGEGAGLSAFRMAKATAGAAVKKAASGIKDAALEAHDKNKQDRMEEEDAAREAAEHDDLARNEHGLKDTNVNTDDMKPNSQKEDNKDNSKLDEFEKQGEGTGKEQGQQEKTDKQPIGPEKGDEEQALQDSHGNTSPEPDMNSGSSADGAEPGSSAAESSDNSGLSNGNGELSLENNAEYLGNDADRMANLENIDRLQEQKDAESARYEGLVNEERALNNANKLEQTLNQALANEKAVNEDQNATSDQKKQASDAVKQAQDNYDNALNNLAPGYETREARNGRLETINGPNGEKSKVADNLRDLNTIQNNAMQREARYASMDKLTGGSGERFSGAQEMAMRRSQEQVLRAHANHRNFDSKEMSGVLSNVDKAKFYRERAQAHKHQVAKNNLTAAGKGLSAVGGAAFGALAEGSAMALNSMTGAEEAYASAQTAGSVADSTWAVGTTAAVEAFQSAKHALNPVVRDARTLGKAEARASSARAFAHKMQYQHDRVSERITAISSAKGAAAVTGEVVKSVTAVPAAVGYAMNYVKADLKTVGHSDKGLENAGHIVERAEQGVERAERVVEARRERRGDDYNPTINVSVPKESRPVKAYNPTAYKSIVSESHESRNSIASSENPLPALQKDGMEQLQDNVQRARANKENAKQKKWTRENDEYSEPIMDDDNDDDYNS